ncbi:PIG-L domain-containing protein [Saccharomonospora piscinae]|uniref:PIG-L domain-containing protein n=2 Tax=Saccharomonospora piscinae TaxID=687388 RepID=A0A1V8ZWJ3_SACPI|nr:PIG-L deacetylase family protein [Saccharomonospora piscinae]OQO89265.1 PIG-L domain-containing protein [Saccharomonospora piscinae]TLW90951.1 PIG-L family deacetylase [Saccharomonospora piscinae]
MNEHARELAPMPDDWRRGLAVVAHPDDMEYGASGAVARWTGAGKEVTYLLATRGEAGIDGMAPDEAAPVREREQRASAAEVGVRRVEFLDHTDGVIEYGLALRRDITAAVRRHRPELVVITNHRDSWPGGGLNMADHRHVGLAALDAVRDAGNRWVFPDLLTEGLAPWQGVRWVAVAASPMATHAVDIGETFEQAVESLRLHRAYLEGLGQTPDDARRFLREVAEDSGRRAGCELATEFELISL